MINYNPSLISIEIVRLKSLSLALGGSITVVDEDKSTDTREITKRYECPLAIARAFIQAHKKTTKYLIPVYTAIVRYDNKIIALERHPLGTFGALEYESLDGSIKKWEPDSLLNIERYINPLVNKGDKPWYFDGRYIFSFLEDLEKTLDEAPYLTSDARFRKLLVQSLDTQKMMYADSLQPVERTCVAYVADTGEYSISPPIWKNLDLVGGTKITEEENALIGYNFDSIDEYMSVNLNFALHAGKVIGELFGFDHIEPLQLPVMMLNLHTVNLPNIPKQIKSTYDIGLSFTHTFAWLLGILRQANTLDTYVAMRSILKYLTQKGLYRKNAFNTQNIFLENQSIADVPKRNLDDLLDTSDFTKQKLMNIIQQAKLSGKTSGKNLNKINGLVADD